MTPDHIGRYEIQRRLGSGGMGALYLARDPQLDRLVAIKLLKDDLRDDAELRERFLREARSVARLRHPNIVIVHDVGEDGGRSFMAMEYIAGDTLARVIARTPPPPLTARLAMIEDLCAGLAHAHGAGIIHRDIKPPNIMIDGDGVLKILDFGIARLGDSGMTQEGMIIGSVNYMSPEQVMGRGVDHRTDIFAAGAVLYEVIALTQAFPGGLDSGVLHRILHEGPAPLEGRVPGIDPELAGIVRRAMARDPAQRYQDASAMRRDLTGVRVRLVEAAPEPPPDAALAPTLIARASTVSPTTRLPSSLQRAAPDVPPGTDAPTGSAGRIAQIQSAPTVVPGETRRASSFASWLAGAAAAIAGVAVIGGAVLVWSSRVPTQPSSAPATAPESASSTPTSVEESPPLPSADAPPVEPQPLPPPVAAAPVVAEGPPPSAAPTPAPRPTPSPSPPPAQVQRAPAPPPVAAPVEQRTPAATTAPPSAAVVEPPLPPVLAAARAAQLLELGSQSEKKEDWPTAISYYERARSLDPSLSSLASASIARVQSQMSADGADAFTRAQQFDASNRFNDAITWYERAVRNLPDSSPEKRIADDRLRVLKSLR